MHYSAFLLLLFCTTVVAQKQEKIICRHLNNGNGLMHGNINSIIQDTNKFIWLAGDEGLQRYDGYEFTNYFNDPTQQNSFPKGRLNSVAIAPNGKLWIASFFDGFGSYDCINGTLKNYRPGNPPILNSNSNGYRDFFIDADNTVFASSTNGVVKIKNDSIVQVFSTQNSALQGSLVGHVVKDKKGNLWIGTVGGLNCLTSRTNTIQNHTNNTTIKAFAANVLKDNIGNKAAIAKLFIDKNNNLWISTWQPSLYKYNIDSNTLIKIQLPNATNNPYDLLATAFVEDDLKNLWIGTVKNGLYQYNSYNNRFNHYTHNSFDEQSISTNEIHALLKDVDNNIWVAGKNTISIFNPEKNVIQSLTSNSSGAITSTFFSADGSLWTADAHWLYHYNNNLKFIAQYKQTNSKQPKDVWAMKESFNKKEIFIGKQDGFLIFNKTTNSFTDYSAIKGLSNNPITDIIERPNGIFYLCRWWWNDNLVELDTRKKLVTPIQFPYNTQAELKFEISNAIQKNKDEYFLFSKKGLFVLNARTNEVTLEDSAFIAGQSILVNNNFYAATAYDGIKVYNLASKTITSISKHNDLNAFNTKSIAYAGKNICWIATNTGLFKWNIATNTFTQFDEKEGLFSTAIIGSSLAVGSTGNVVFSNGELFYINPSIIKATKQPPVAIISCTVGKKNILPNQFNSTIVVNYFENNIQIKYAAINHSQSQIKYQHKLVGYDKDWVNGEQRFVNYTNLPAGKYTLQVRITNENDVWGTVENKLQFKVTQAFYTAWWFYAFIAILVLVTIYFYYKSRINRIIELQKLRNNISRDLHDEVGSTLSSISILSTSVLNNMQTQPIKAKDWVIQIGHYAIHMLNVMDDIVWTINPKMDSFESLIARMKETAYTLVDATDIKLKFDYNETLTQVSLPMLTKKSLYLIFKETVNNAIKHAHCSTIQIILKKENSHLFMQIIDDGKGFDVQHEVNRNGLKNIHQRAKEINAKITVTSSSNNGTQLILIIPL
jgi:ligand-binding sensor domain-containing protein